MHLKHIANTFEYIILLVPNEKLLYSLNIETEPIKTLGLYWESN